MTVFEPPFPSFLSIKSISLLLIPHRLSCRKMIPPKLSPKYPSKKFPLTYTIILVTQAPLLTQKTPNQSPRIILPTRPTLMVTSLNPPISVFASANSLSIGGTMIHFPLYLVLAPAPPAPVSSRNSPPSLALLRKSSKMNMSPSFSN